MSEPAFPSASVAIVGMAGRFPGAESVAAFWRNILAGAEAITMFTPEELRTAGVPEADLANPDYVPARGLMAQPEAFDAAFFSIGQREAALMDPQQRLFLETCWHALEDGAIDPKTFSGSVGVWGGLSTGMSNNTYLMSNLHGTGVLQPEDRLPAMLGNENDYLTTRVSYKLNLRGPSVNVQTACSTSLVAVAQACQALATWQCDAALAGGVSVSYPQKEGYLFQEGGIGSPDGHCRPFDAAAQGTVFSNGVGVVLLRRLDDALADGHTIYAVIRGAATNNDGAAKVSFAAPSVDGQAEVIAMAHAVADVSPGSIAYVETHGTGTPLGDPIEVAALTKAFRAGGATGVGYCALGSVKSHVGHLDSAAGVAGLIVAAHAVRDGQLPPVRHFQSPNPKCHFATSPFVVDSAARPWPRAAAPRRAGVSSFGIGGTNAHVVIEEPPALPPRPDPSASSTLLVWSAKSAAALQEATRNLAAHLAAHPHVPLPDIAHTLRVGRQSFAHRRALVGRDHGDAAAALTAGDPLRVVGGVSDLGSPAVTFMFAGGGAQHVDMARGLMAGAPVFRTELERCWAAMPHASDVVAAMHPAAGDEVVAAAQLERPSIGLPALFAVGYALARQWMAWGVQPSALIGHSMGEYTAACLAGVMALEDALGLVHLRAQLFETLAPGGMVGVPLAAADLEASLEPGLAIAAVNAADSCVVAGPPAALAALVGRLEREGVECRRLHIAVAAHSMMVEPILAEFERHVRTLTLHPPSIPIVSNVTGTWLSAEDACAAEYWVRHLRRTVRFADGLSTLLADPGRILLEVGPGATLSSFARQHPLLGSTHVVQPSLRHVRDASDDIAVLQQALGRLWTRGVAPDWSALPGASEARRVSLPLYPFERRSYLLEPIVARAASVAPPAPVAPLFDSPTAPVTSMTSPSAPYAPTLRSRADRIADRLSELLQKLSGMSAQELNPAASFLEMGFDSLFLTQASLRFKNEFKVRITFRQLFEDAPTIQALAAYIDSKMPADAMPAPAMPALAVALPEPVPAPALVAAAGASAPLLARVAPAALPSSAGALERVVHEQLRVMSEQLRMLGGAPFASGLPASTTAVEMTAVPVPTMPTPAEPAGSAFAPAASDTPAQFGPFRAVDKSQQGLTSHQQTHLDAFVERYTRKTPASKALTEAGRNRMADPRAISGFRKIWKELVYQIATRKSAGSRMWDIDGNEYIDVTSGFGVNIFGYDVPEVTAALHAQVDAGIELGSLSPLAKEAAELICDITGMERATFANTGSESLAGAIRAARTVTGRDFIAVFEDEYHGISEEVLVKSVGPKGRHRSAPAAPGIPDHMVEKVIVLHYDDPNALEVLRSRADEIAAVIIEPVQNRHPDFRPAETIKAVRRVTEECEIPLIFDEMITGFRLHPRGAQGYFGVDVDMACYGKIMSGGLPIAAIAGKAKYLDAFDGGPWQFGDDSFPEGGVTFFGGTFTRNVLSLASAVAALRKLKTLTAADYQALNAKSDHFVAAINALFERYRAPMRLEHCGSICNILFIDDSPLPKLFTYFMREKGVHIWDRPFFISMIHTEADLAEVVRVADQSLADMQVGHFLGEPAPGRGPGSGATSDVVPFTDPQMEVWLGSQLSPAASSAFNEVVALEILKPLDVAVLQRAVDDVAARHESLRMTVSTTPPGFRLSPVMLVPVTVHELTAAPDLVARRDEVIRSYNQVAMDFEHGPLWRVGVVREPVRDVLVLAVHHLICDGWSFGVLLRELSACYAAHAAGRPHGLPPALQATEYTHLLAERKNSDEARDTAAFWLEQYRTIPEPLNLPVDRPRPPVSQFTGRRLGVTFDAGLAQRVRQFATAHRTTSFSTLLAAFEVLISRLTGQTDFVIGIPMAGQALVEQQNLIAHCVNFIAVRCRVDADVSFADHVAALTRQALDLNDHQEFTYLNLLTALRLPRSIARDPLVSVSFTLEPSFAKPAFGGLPSNVLSVPRATSRRDLHVNVMETPAGLAVEVDYNADIFDEDIVRHWLDAFRVCLDAALATPARTVAMLPLVSAEEARRLCAVPPPATPLRFDPDLPLPQLFEAQVARTPAAIAQVCGDRELSYEVLNTRANRIAHALRARGVGRGVLVGVCLERGDDLLAVLLGVLKAGGAYLPIDLAYPSERLAFMLADAGAPVLVTQATVAARVPSTAAAVVLVEELVEELRESAVTAANPLPISGPDDLAYVIYTSGTSGAPKGSKVSHRNVVSLMAGSAPLFQFGASDVWTLFHSYAFDFSVWEMWGGLLYGGTVVVVPQSVSRSPEAFYDLLVRDRVTVLSQTPSAFRQLMAVDLARPAPSRLSLRYVVFGGEALDTPGLGPWFDRHGDQTPTLVNGYGITETTVFVSFHRVTAADTAHQGASVIGAPMPLWQVHVLDDRLQPVPVGARGELYVGGAGVTAGYLNRDDLTRTRFVPNPFGAGTLYKSGDQARHVANGELQYLGRLDAQVKIRGFRVELGEIEAVLARHPAVADCRVVPSSSAAGDLRLVAYLQLAGARPDAAVLQTHLRQFVPEYMVPALFVPVESFPLTANGKLDLRALPDPDAARLASAATMPAAMTPTESRLAALWCELLGVSAVQRTDNFFDLGGHSLLAIQLVHRVGGAFGVRLAPVALFEHSRLDGLAACIDAMVEPPPPPERVPERAPSPSAPAAFATSAVVALAPAPAPVPVLALASRRSVRKQRPDKVLVQMAPGAPNAPFFWVHGIGGELFSYMAVTKHLAVHRPVFGFAADWTVSFSEEERTVETIAASYVHELIAVQPEGPYHLGGYCSAAVLVLEIARQLEAQGRVVGAFAILDYAVVDGSGPAPAPPPLLAFVKNLPRWIRDDALPSGLADLADRVRSKVRRLRRRGAGPADDGSMALDIRDELGLYRFPESKVELLRLHLKVITDYVPKPFTGTATLLLPRAQPLLGPWPDANGDMGWKEIALGGVEVYSVPGSHSTFLSEPFAGPLAERLELTIRAAEARAAAAGPAVVLGPRSMATRANA